MHKRINQLKVTRFSHLFISVVLSLIIGLQFISPPQVKAATLPAGFSESVIFSGLAAPTAMTFAPDGRIFVAEKRGLIKVFDNLQDTTPTIFADLRTNVYNFWDRGLLGLALDPNFPTKPYVYVSYTHDAAIGGTAPRWGTADTDSDGCPTPPGPNSDGCIASGRLSRLQANGNAMTGTEQVLIEDWCQISPSHSMGDIKFGPDGALYISGGDGAHFAYTDYGQGGNPKNPCGDPPTGVGTDLTPPTTEGGAFRSQDIRTTGDPQSADGTILRVNPDTGAPLPDNPFISSTDPITKRLVTAGLRNPFRFNFRPGTGEIWAGDVGLGTWEEINRVINPLNPVVNNMGWPCYEGVGTQPTYAGLGTNICNNLINQPNAVTPPYYSYNHDEKIVATDSCPTGGSSTTGIIFNPLTGSNFPTNFNGALFFADHSRNCIWAMYKGTNGLPDPQNIEPLVSQAANPVDLDFSPSGELFYTDLEGGTIRKVTYSDPSITPCPTDQFHAQYYNSKDFTTPTVLTRCETEINNDWALGSPAPEVNIDNFAVRWEGKQNFVSGNYTFSSTTDDGVRIWVDDVLIIDKWIDQGATTYTAIKTMSAGEHKVKVEYYDAAAGALARVNWQINSGGSCPTGQYMAEYFNNMTLTGTPVFVRCENTVSYDWGLTGPGNGIPVDAFSVRWSGNFNIAAGTYLLSTTSDDGNRVWLDNNKVIDAWADHGAITTTATKNIIDGIHSIKVEYYENAGNALSQFNYAPTALNDLPVPTITTPANTFTWGVGDTINFSGSATDAQDGTLPASALSWTLIMHHCPSNCHTHAIQTFDGVASGSVASPDHEYPSHIELVLTAKDSSNSVGTTSIIIQPKTVDLTINSNPSGLQQTLNTFNLATPFTKTVIQKSNNSLTAISPQTLNNISYLFNSWSDSGAQTHNITAPITNATYTSTYSSNTPGYAAQYWNITNPGPTLVIPTTAPNLTRQDTAIDFDWGQGGPGTPIGINSFAARWIRTENITTAGTYRFTTTSDDGIRVYVDNVLLIDKWQNQGATTYTADKALTVGNHTIKVEYYENDSGALARFSFAPALTPSPPPPPTYTGQYWNVTNPGPTLVIPATAANLTRQDTAIDFDWGQGGPGAPIGINSFAARWTKTENITTAGTYKFTTTSDDGIRVYVDNQLIINKWINQGATTYTANKVLTVGNHTIKVEYYENDSGALARFSFLKI